MRRTLLVIALIVASLGAFVPSATALSLGVNYFYDDLAPYGDWFQMEDHGWVWTPKHVAADWRPYTRGHWAYSDDYGWLWLSEEDFGWATYHYGRWFYDAAYGWTWVPGDEWAPAWVSWRAGDGYVGWAPLPPEYEWRAGARVAPAFGSSFGPRQYVFVPERHFFDPVVYRHVVPVATNDSIVRVTRDVTRFEAVGDRVANRALDVREVEQAAGRAVPRYRVEEVRTAAPRRPVVQGNTVRVFHPTRQQIEQAPPPRTAPVPSAVPRLKARPAQPPADPRAVRLQRPPVGAPAPDTQATRQAERREARAERERRQEQARQQHQQQVREQQAARERAKEQARQQHQEEVRQQQLARQREKEQRKQQPAPERKPPQDERRLNVQPRVPDPDAVTEQQRARERAQAERERQKREQQGRKKRRSSDKPKPPEKPNG